MKAYVLQIKPTKEEKSRNFPLLYISTITQMKDTSTRLEYTDEISKGIDFSHTEAKNLQKFLADRKRNPVQTKRVLIGEYDKEGNLILITDYATEKELTSNEAETNTDEIE